MNDEAVLENLVSLHDLQELCVRYMQNGLFREVVISPAAGLTKLTVHRCQDRLEVGLPMETLQNVWELVVDEYPPCMSRESGWPTTWHQLTNVTRLVLSCGREHHLDRPPEFLMGMASLRDLGVTVHARFGDALGGGYLARFTAGLPCLNRLCIHVVGVTQDFLTGAEVDLLDQRCKAEVRMLARRAVYCLAGECTHRNLKRGLAVCENQLDFYVQGRAGVAEMRW